MHAPMERNEVTIIKRKLGGLLIGAGTIALAAMIGLMVYNVWDAGRARAAADQAAEHLEDAISEMAEKRASEAETSQEEATEVFRPLEEAQEAETPLAEVDGVWYIGLLELPALELELPVIHQWSEEDAKLAPCRYSGSVEEDNLIIAGHNYAGHFGTLKNLHAGDAVRFTSMDGQTHAYAVTELEVLGATDTEQLLQGDWDLTLFTCTVGGADRVVVRCMRIES